MGKIYELIATGFYVGKIKKAPGTWGSLLAVFGWFFDNWFLEKFAGGNWQIYWLIALAALCFLSVKSTEFYQNKYDKKDAPEIVIDEICGQILLFYIFSLFAGKMVLSWPLLLLGFVLFRLFDITKPFPICLVDKNLKTPFGVLLDDLIAGFFGAIVMILAYPI